MLLRKLGTTGVQKLGILLILLYLNTKSISGSDFRAFRHTNAIFSTSIYSSAFTLPGNLLWVFSLSRDLCYSKANWKILNKKQNPFCQFRKGFLLSLLKVEYYLQDAQLCSLPSVFVPLCALWKTINCPLKGMKNIKHFPWKWKSLQSRFFKIHQTISSLISWNKNIQFVLWNWKWIVFHNEKQQDFYHPTYFMKIYT